MGKNSIYFGTFPIFCDFTYMEIFLIRSGNLEIVKYPITPRSVIDNAMPIKKKRERKYNKRKTHQKNTVLEGLIQRPLRAGIGQASMFGTSFLENKYRLLRTNRMWTRDASAVCGEGPRATTSSIRCNFLKTPQRQPQPTPAITGKINTFVGASIYIQK